VTFTSVEYIFFLLTAVALCRSMPRRVQPLWITLLSCLFYALWDVRALLPLFGATILAYLAGLQIGGMPEGRGRQIVAYGSVALLVLSLLLFKDFPKSARPLYWFTPLGISYYTFKLVSYVLDVFWGKQHAERDAIAFASYAIFFPQIVAGPIQRSDDYLLQVRAPQPLSRLLLHRAVGRIALGLFKKLLIADRIGVALNAVYGQVHGFIGAPLLVTFYLFPIQLYADFSGLTDIAIGSALLFGIESPENFYRPFSATNISEYWRRWHMSLTGWTSDYVFTPLRMATRNWARIGLVFSVSADALTAKPRKALFKSNPSWKPWTGWLGGILTFHLVALGMVFWRAKTVPDALWLLAHMWSRLGGFAASLTEFVAYVGWRSFALGLVAYTVMELAERFWNQLPIVVNIQSPPRWFRWSAQGVSYLLLAVGILLMFVHGSVKEPFLYEVF
jgi:alginate O-acetyltransferase complex protein AlgI